MYGRCWGGSFGSQVCGLVGIGLAGRDSSSDSDYSRSRSRSKSRRQKKEHPASNTCTGVSGEQASRSRDAAEARVKTLALRPPVVKPAMAPAKSAADVAREKAEFEEFCKARMALGFSS
eukprot:s2900_g19.t1